MERALELIQKHLHEIATPAELAELVRLLAADSAVAAAFAQATRVDTSLLPRLVRRLLPDGQAGPGRNGIGGP